jgi:hypothetical protein
VCRREGGGGVAVDVGAAAGGGAPGGHPRALRHAQRRRARACACATAHRAQRPALRRPGWYILHLYSFYTGPLVRTTPSQVSTNCQIASPIKYRLISKYVNIQI